MKKILGLIAYILGINLCHAQELHPFTIRGKIDTIPMAVYELYYQKNGKQFVDTLYLDDKSEFVYKGYISEPSRLFFGIENKYNKRLLGFYTAYQFWIEPNAMIAFTGHKVLKEKEVNGSNIETIDEYFQMELDRLLLLYKDDKSILKHKLKSLYQQNIIKNIDNYYSVWLMHSGLNNNHVDMKFANLAYKDLNKNLKNTYLGKEIEKTLSFHVGNKFPQFSIPDVNGKIYTVDNFKGKYLLIDFWASWCIPCREENPYLQEAFEKYHHTNFDIVSISFDTNKVNWTKAINDDGMTWTQLIEINGLKSDLVDRYMITGIPTNFLLDKNGIIIAKDLRKGDLLNFLDKVYKEN